jgi:hypothetical protein
MGQVVVRQGPGTSEATPASYFCQGRGRHGQAQRSLGNILPTVRSAQCGFRGSVLRRGIHAATLVTGTVRDELGRPKGNAFSVASVRPHSKHTQTRRGTRVHRGVAGFRCAPRCSSVAKCSFPTPNAAPISRRLCYALSREDERIRRIPSVLNNRNRSAQIRSPSRKSAFKTPPNSRRAIPPFVRTENLAFFCCTHSRCAGQRDATKPLGRC